MKGKFLAVKNPESETQNMEEAIKQIDAQIAVLEASKKEIADKARKEFIESTPLVYVKFCGACHNHKTFRLTYWLAKDAPCCKCGKIGGFGESVVVWETSGFSFEMLVDAMRQLK
jgi:hypothetical protein